MKLTKKALSLLLAVLMIMTSVSVSFDSLDIQLSFSAFAANGDGVQAFYDAALAHGKTYGFGSFTYDKTGNAGSNGTITKTWTYTAKSYAEFKSYADVITKMKTAAFNLDEYTKCNGHNNFGYCGDAWEGTTQGNGCTDWVHVKNALTGYMGESKYADLKAYGIDTLLDATFNRNEVLVNNSGNDNGVCSPSGNGQDNGTTTSSGNLPEKMWNNVVVNAPANSDVEIVAAAASINDIPASYNGTVTLTLGLYRASQYKSTSCTTKTGDKYHLAIIESKAASSGPTYSNSKTIDKSVLTSAKTTIETTYANYYNAADVNAVLAISSDINTLTVAREALNTAKDGVINKYGEATYKKFYDSTKVASAIKHLDDAIQYLQFAPIVDELNRLNAIDYSGYNEAQLLEHLTAFDTQMAKYDVLDAATQALILEKFDNFDIIAIKANLAQLRHDWEVYAIRAEKVRVDTHISMYNGYTKEMIEDGSLTSAMLTTAIGAIGGDVNKLNNYVRSTVDEVCGADYMTNLETLYRDLQRLGAIAGVNDAFLVKYAQFSDEIKNAVAEDSATLLESLQNYEAWYEDLKAFIADSKADLGEENAEMLFKDLDDAMLEYMANAFVVLQTRTENEILTAKKLLDNYKAAYGTTVTMVSVSKYKAFRYAVETINRPAVEYLQASPNATISQEVLDILATIDVTFPAYEEFLASKGFSNWQTSTIPNFSREDSEEDIVRENVDLDGDGIGEYEVTDAKIQNVIDILDAALSSNAVKGIGLDLGTLLSGLVEDVIISDSFINTVVNMLYPLVLKEFGKVFANDLPTEASGQKVTYKKGLHGVFKGAGFEIYPDLLATELNKSPRKAAYADTIKRLNDAYTQAKSKYPNVGATNDDAYSTVLDPAGGTGASGNPKVILDKTAWDSDALYDVVLDDEGNPVIDEATGEVKKVFALTWGIDAAKEAGMSGDELKELFYQTFDDAVEGLKPLLCALIANETWFAEQDGLASALSGMINVGLELGATANSGYANLIVPIFETLGVSYTSVDTVEKTYTTYSDDVAAILKAILEPIFGLVDTIGDKPLNTVLGILPNLCFALSAQMVPSLLSMLKTSITYLAPVSCGAVDSPSGGVDIDVGTMLNIGDLIDLSDGLNSILRQFGLNIPAIDQGYIATLGTMTEITTQRKDWIYTKPASGKAKYIEANKADVLLYLIDYALGSDLLSMFMEIPAEGFLGELFAKLAVAETRNDVLAALVELLNGDGKYKDLANYTWYEGIADGTAVGTLTDPAVQIYLNTDNDWTEAKANYLYENIDEIVVAVLKLANVDLDETTEEVDGEIGDLIGGLLGGVLSAETLTTIAGLLGSISDLDALLAGDGEEATEGEDANAPETVAEEGEEAAEEEKEPLVKIELNINNLIKDLLGIDLKASYGKYAEINAELEADPTYVYDFGKEIKTTADFVAVLTEMLAPISGVLGFILDGKDLEINLTSKKIKLNGYNGYDSAIVPVLEALGCDVKAHGGNNGLALTLEALAGKIDSLIAGNTIKGIIDILPGLFYFLAGNNLATVVSNLLQPVYVILDTIRPVYDLDLDELLAGIEINGAPLNLDLRRLNLNFVFELVASLLPADLDLGTLLDDVKGLIYSICKCVGVEYTSVSKLAGQKTWKRGALTAEGFSGGDLITVLLSYVLDWALVEDNAATLDALLKTEGLIGKIGVVFADAEISYATPDWKYTETKGNTLEALNYPNDWTDETAQFFADNLANMVDAVISMIEIDGVKYESLATLLTALVEGFTGDIFTAETINNLIGMISGVLANVDDTLLNLGYELLGLDLVGLKNYVCAEGKVTNLDTFVAELAGILDNYAKPLVDLLFFGDDIRLAKKGDGSGDQIVINGGLGYEAGLALILEALGCEVPAVADATATTVLGSLVNRINEILEAPVNEVLDMLPNLVYFLNANGLGVAVDNMLKPVYVLLDKINALGVLENKIVIEDLLKFTTEDGEVVAINLAALSLEYIINVVEKLTGLDLSAAEAVLVNLNMGTIEAAKFGCKMTADRKDTITVILTTALNLIDDDDFAAQLDELLGTEIIAAIDDVFNGEAYVNADVDWDYAFGNGAVIGDDVVALIKAITEYPNDWDEETAEYLADNLPGLVDTVIALIEINGTKYDSLSALLADVLADANIFTTATLQSLIDMIAELLGNNYDALLGAGIIIDLDIAGLKSHKVTEGIATADAFAAELATILSKYVPGAIEWLLLGRNFEFFTDLNGETLITLNGSHGYAYGLALLLEALGCENLPTVEFIKENDTAAIIDGVLASIAARIDAIVANPVEEILNLIPNVLYFLNANGVSTVIKNTMGSVSALVNRLEGFDVALDLDALVDLKGLLGLPAEAKISMSNLSLDAIIEAAGYLTGLDLTALKDVVVPFALGDAVAYTSVSGETAYKAVLKDGYDKGDMLSVIVTAVLHVVFENEQNAEVIGADVINAIKAVFANAGVVYAEYDWNYAFGNGAEVGDDVVELVKTICDYPGDWTAEKAQYFADNLPALLDTVISMIEIGGVKYESVSALLNDLLTSADIFTAETLQDLIDMIADLLAGIDEGIFEVAGLVLNVDINGLKAHKVGEVNSVVDFAKELATILSTYVPGVIEWLFLGNDYTFFVKEEGNGIYSDFITINGAHGYAYGLAPLLEALGCDGLPTVDFENPENNDTADIIRNVLVSVAKRIDTIVNAEEPVGVVLDMIPELLYFLNANGVSTAINNTIAAVTAIITKLAGFGISLDLNELVDLKGLLGLPAEAKLSLNNLSLDAILEAASMLTGFDLAALEDVLVPFALGKAVKYDSVSGEAYKLEGAARRDVITVIFTAALHTLLKNEANSAKFFSMVGIDGVTKLEDLLNPSELVLMTPNYYDKVEVNPSTGAVISQIQNPNNWSEEDAAYLAKQLPEAVDKIVRLLTDGDEVEYETLSALLTDLTDDIFTTATLESIVGLLQGLLENIDDNLLDAAGLVLDIDPAGLKKHKVHEVNNVEEFAKELSYILTTYAKGLVEWLLFGNDFEFFVNDKSNYKTQVNLITITGNNGYEDGIAILLEALGCEGLLKVEGHTTEEIVGTALISLANRIDEIFANPVNEIVDLLPNLLYFINTNGLAVVLNNTLAGIYALLEKLSVLGIEIDIKELVNLKELLGLPEEALISLEKLDVEALLDIVRHKVPGLYLNHISNILCPFALGKIESYDTVSSFVDAKRMVYGDVLKDRGDIITVIANAAIMTLGYEADNHTFDKDGNLIKGNFDFFFNLVGKDVMLVIMSLFNFAEPDVKDFDWKYVNADGSYDKNAIYSGFSASENYDKNAVYGDLYTKDMAQYIATNFPDFVDNMVYLIGVDVDGDGNNEQTLEALLGELLNGGLYNSDNAKAIQTALYDVINNALMNIKVGGESEAAFSVGPYIKMILKLSKVADIDGIKAVEIGTFNNDKGAFVAAICDILEPIYPVLRFVLADEDFRFFTTVDEKGQPTDAITLRGAEGYAYGIIPLLELLECNADAILTPAEYYEEIAGGNNDVMITSILTPLLSRVDEILADPAGEVIEMLPNIVYFINSNGLDTVVQNLLAAVFEILEAIKPVKEIDLYDAVYKATGLDVAHVDFEALVNFALGLLNKQGYSFKVEDVEALSDLAVGQLTHYTSKNGKTAYKMVYVDGISGGKAEMVNILEGLIITFITAEENQKVVVDFLVDKLGMSESGKEFAEGTIEVLAGALKTELGMQAALTAVYYIYYGLDVGADSTVGGLDDINKIWKESLESIKNNVPGMGDVIDDILDLDALDGIISDEGLAPKGLAKFFAKITETFQKIGNFFKNLFSFSFLKK